MKCNLNIMRKRNSTSSRGSTEILNIITTQSRSATLALAVKAHSESMNWALVNGTWHLWCNVYHKSKYSQCNLQFDGSSTKPLVPEMTFDLLVRPLGKQKDIGKASSLAPGMLLQFVSLFMRSFILSAVPVPTMIVQTFKVSPKHSPTRFY